MGTLGKKGVPSEVEELGVSGIWGVKLRIDWPLENLQFLSFENISVKKGGITGSKKYTSAQ